MEQPTSKREFSMKYCPDLEDDVVVMKTGERENQNKICLSSHLCQADMRMSCGHECPQSEKREETHIS